MKKKTEKKWTSIFISLLLMLLGASRSHAQIKKVVMGYTGTNPYTAALIVTKEVGFFRKNGLDVTVVFTPGGSLGTQVMASGDVAMVMSDGVAAVLSRFAGFDSVIIVGLLNTFPYSLVSGPEIKKVDQLKGSTMAISRFGSGSDLGLRFALAKVGLNPEKDVTIIQMGSQADRFAALQSKRIQATIIAPPFTLIARKMGLNVIVDMAQLNIPFQFTALVTTKVFLKGNHDIAMQVVKSLVEGIHFYKTEKEASIRIMGKYLNTDDREALEETYNQIALRMVPEKPYPTLAGLQSVLDELSKKNPKAKTARPEDFVDLSFVKRFDEEGFIGRLYKR